MADVPNDESSSGTPRWVKVFGLITLVVIVVFVVLLLTGRGNHGPGRHASAATDHAARQP